jgi:hypothetical protein
MSCDAPALTLRLRRPEGDLLVPAVWRDAQEGWSNGTTIGKADAPLTRIILHWFNLPDLHGPIRLAVDSEGGERRSSNRWRSDAGGWRITLDARPDHDQVWTDLHKSNVYVMTHVMELRRTDGATFTSVEAEPVLAALHIGVSFALGSWAAPMLPVGEGMSGDRVWEDWRLPHCDPARSIARGWWHERQHASLAELVNLVITTFADPDRRPALRLQMMLAILAMKDQGFTEQRIMIGAAGLEHIMWQTLVLGGRMTKRQYRRRDAYELLRIVLSNAQIPIDVDPALLPAAAAFVAGETGRQGQNLDGAEVVTRIRNRLVHPKGAQERVYRQDGLVIDTWLLIRHYLTLLILHSLGYNGAYRDLRKIHGWATEVGTVPWA